MNYRTCRYQLGSRFLLSFLLLGLVLQGLSTRAQDWKPAPATAVPGVCAPVRSTQYDGVAPSLPDAASEPGTARKLAMAYRQIALRQDLPSARITLEELRSGAVAAGDTCVDAMALYGLGAEAESGRPEAAADFFHQAESVFQGLHSMLGVARVELRLGRLYRIGKHITEALASYAKAEELFEREGDAESALLARLAAQGGRLVPDYGQLVARAQELRLPCVQAEIEEVWANRFWHEDHFAEAREHYRASDALYAQCPRRQAARAALQTEMGRMERQQGRPEAALEHYKLALTLQLQSGDTSLVPQTYNAMGVAYEALGDYPRAIARYKQGLAYARSLHSQALIEFVEGNLAATYSRNHQPLLALPLLKTLSENVPDVHLRCLRLGQLGTVYSHISQDERAVAIFGKSKEACLQDNERERVAQNDSTLTTSELRLHLYADALRDAQQGLSILEEARSHLVATDAYKQGFASTALVRGLYNNAIAALTALHRGEEAFELAEQARARAFLDLLASHQEASAKTPDPHFLAQYRKDLIDSPAHAAPMTAAAMLGETSQLHSTLLAYWAADDCLYLWVARSGGPVVEVRQPVSADRLAKLVEQTRSRAKPREVPVPAWRVLYQLLVAPIEAQLPQDGGALLTIVPSGPLFSLSFAALRGSDGRYLTERFRLHTTPSISLLGYTHRNPEANADQSPHYLLVSNPQRLPSGNDAHALPALPGTALEAEAIARSLSSGAVTRLSGRDASLGSLTAALPGATTIHFATHAVLNDADPYASFLALDDTNHDGRLTIAQIYALPLQSRLVVLSACSTGLGKITGDGVAGMSRAFFYAGAASVMTTLWDIADQPTAEMQPRFYAALAAGQSPSAALRTAQLSMLRDLRRHRIRVETLAGAKQSLPEDPSYWASFSLSGQP